MKKLAVRPKRLRISRPGKSDIVLDEETTAMLYALADDSGKSPQNCLRALLKDEYAHFLKTHN